MFSTANDESGRHIVEPALKVAGVRQAADAVEKAAGWATVVLRRFHDQGVVMDLLVSEAARSKLGEMGLAGKLLLIVLDDLKLRIRLGPPEL